MPLVGEKFVHVTRENGEIVEVTKEERFVGKGTLSIGGVVIGEITGMSIERPVWKKKGRRKRKR